MMDRSSNNEDDYLFSVEQKIDRPMSNGQRNIARAMFSEGNTVEQAADFFNRSPPPKKRKARAGSKTKFVLVYDNMATSIDFDEEPSADKLRSELKTRNGDSAFWPLFYYCISSWTYCRFPQDGELPETMFVDETAEGRILLVTAPNTPPGKPTSERLSLTRIEASKFSTKLLEAFEKALPPNVKPETISESFDTVPVLFEDQTILDLVQYLTGKRDDDDKRVSIFFAVPGAGKSRTIVESCKKAAPKQWTRTKLSDGILLRKFQDIGATKKDEFPKAEYSQIKRWFIPEAMSYLANLKDGNPTVRVIHFDEVQHLMGHCVVSSANFESMRGKATLEDFFMPAFCEAIHSFTSRQENPRVIMSGTNFFSPLAFNPGSALKLKDDLHIHGRFPSRWVIDELLKRYFVLDVLEEDQVTKSAFESIVDYVSANRRVVEFFLIALKRTLVYTGTKLTKEQLLQELSNCKDSAFNQWTKGCLKYTSSSCMAALALCVFPESYGGTLGKTTSGFPAKYEGTGAQVDAVILPEDCLPDDVRIYANAGGLNIWKHSDTHVAVEIPVGCLRANLLNRCHGLSNKENTTAMDAIQHYRNRVDPKAKGHLFERAFAFELTTFGSNIGSLICRTLSTSGREMIMDGHIFGCDWVYESSFIENWQSGKVRCVFERSKDAGKRIVDVGFPVVNVASGKAEFWRVYCELKCGYESGVLWKECADFLRAIASDLQKNQFSCAIFIASRSFVEAKLKDDYDPSVSKKFVTEHELYKKRFFVLDGSSLAGKSILNLSDMHGELVESNFSISSAASRVARSDIYASESQM